MSVKKKPLIIRFDDEEDKQKFLNWALAKSKPSPGINRAIAAMRSAQKTKQSN